MSDEHPKDLAALADAADPLPADLRAAQFGAIYLASLADDIRRTLTRPYFGEVPFSDDLDKKSIVRWVELLREKQPAYYAAIQAVGPELIKTRENSLNRPFRFGNIIAACAHDAAISMEASVYRAVWFGAAPLEWASLTPDSSERMDLSLIVEHYEDVRTHFAEQGPVYPDVQELVAAIQIEAAQAAMNRRALAMLAPKSESPAGTRTGTMSKRESEFPPDFQFLKRSSISGQTARDLDELCKRWVAFDREFPHAAWGNSRTDLYKQYTALLNEFLEFALRNGCIEEEVAERDPETEELARWEALKTVGGKFPPRWTEFRHWCELSHIPVGSHNDVLTDIETAWPYLLGEGADERALLNYLFQEHGIAPSRGKKMPLEKLSELLFDDCEKKRGQARGNGGGKEKSGDASSGDQKPKRSTEKGEARVKLIAALTEHHKYAVGGGCLNEEPIGNNELADLADVDKSTASDFFAKFFLKKGEKRSGHAKYMVLCRRNFAKVLNVLKLLNNDFSVDDLYGDTPPNESDERDR